MFKEIATYVFNCNFFIYFFISRSIIKANEVDSKNVNIKVNFLCNLQKCQKTNFLKTFFEVEVEIKKWSSLTLLRVNKLFLITPNLMKISKKNSPLDFVDINGDVVEVMVVISSVIK